MRNEITSDDALVVVLDAEIAKFSNSRIPLVTKETRQLEKWKRIVTGNPSAYGRNAPKRRSHYIMKNLWEHCPKAYFLCGIRTTMSSLGGLKSVSYMAAVLEWASRVQMPPGPAETMDRYSAILPPQSQSARQYKVKLLMRELLGFLGKNYPDEEELEVTLPFGGVPLPYTRFGTGTWQVKMEFDLNIAHALLRHIQSKQAEHGTEDDESTCERQGLEDEQSDLAQHDSSDKESI